MLDWPKDWVRSPTSDGYNEGRLFNVLETWYLAAIGLRRWDDLASVSHALGNAKRPGEPVEHVIEPAKPLLLADVWGPRHSVQPHPPSSAAASAATEQATTNPATVQRNKAPPPGREVQSAPAGPPPPAHVAKAPGSTGACNEVAKGATSKSGQVPKKPPPQGPPGGWPQEVKPETQNLVAQTPSQPAARAPAAEQPPPLQGAGSPPTKEEQEYMASQATEKQLADVAQAAQLLAA
eukprot:5398201-Amphidinium_carterae.1